MNNCGNSIFLHLKRIIKQTKSSLQAIIFIFTISLLSCQTKPDASFDRIPDGLSQTEDLIRAIEPEKDYDYWACIISNPFLTKPKTEIITRKGNITQLVKLKFTPPKTGFKSDIWKGYYYIIYTENDVVSIIKNEKELISFMGHINSLEKALLIAKIKGFDIGYSREIGSSYKKTENGYELYLVKFHKCPVKTEPFKVNIDTLGNYTAKSLGFYYNVDSNICED